MPINGSIETKVSRLHVNSSNCGAIDLEGLHFADFTPTRRLLVDRYVKTASQFLPFLSAEFLSNIATTTFIEWQRITGLSVDAVCQVADSEDIPNQINEIWELFLRNISKFLVNAEDIRALDNLKRRIQTQFLHGQICE